jgi:hypothetical protein
MAINTTGKTIILDSLVARIFTYATSSSKMYTPNLTLSGGDVVVINSPNLPLMSWQMGHVIDVHPGADQVVRVATVKTADGVMKRPVVKLVKLPLTRRKDFNIFILYSFIYY